MTTPNPDELGDSLMDNNLVSQTNAQEATTATTNARSDAALNENREFTRTDFEAALRKVSRRRASRPDEGKSGT